MFFCSPQIEQTRQVQCKQTKYFENYEEYNRVSIAIGALERLEKKSSEESFAMNDAKIAKSRFLYWQQKGIKTRSFRIHFIIVWVYLVQFFFLSLFDVIFVEINHCLNISFINWFTVEID